MDFYEEASLVMVPSGYKDQKVYSSVPDDGSADLTFSRASNATRVNSEGLVEKVRTNLFPTGSNLSTAGWTLSNATLTAGQVDPNGGNTAMRIQFAATSGFASYVLSGSDNIYNRSLYIKSASNTTIRIAEIYGGTSKDINVTTSYQRFDIGAANFISGNFGIDINNQNDNAAKDITIAFVQIETGDIATDYIPTTSAAVSVGPVSGLPRLNYDAVNPTSASLLLEPQRTNLLTFSEQQDNAVWTKAGATITTNATTSPDGYTNADKVVESTSTGTHGTYISAGISNSTAYTWSGFFKAGERTKFRLLAQTGGTPQVVYNLTNGTIQSVDAGVTASIESYGNGWYRCIATTTSTSTTAYFNWAMLDGSSQAVYTGDGTSGLYVWGAQLEEGSYATSYIPTLSTAVTRVADAAYKTGIGSLFGASAGTIYFETTYYPETNTGGGERFVYAQENTSAGSIRLWQDLVGGNQQFRMLVSDGGVQVVNASVNVSTFLSTTQPSVIKWAMAYENDRFVTFINGAQRMIDTSGTAPTITEINFNNTFLTKMPLAQALVFPIALSDSDLATLTTL